MRKLLGLFAAIVLAIGMTTAVALADDEGQESVAQGPYSITIEKSDNGTVSANPAKADAGSIVTLKVNPSNGYELESITVSFDAENVPTVVKDGKYTFTMPNGNVKVSAKFKAAEKPELAAEPELEPALVAESDPALEPVAEVADDQGAPAAEEEEEIIILTPATDPNEGTDDDILILAADDATYNVTIDPNIDHGTVTVNPATAAAGDTIMLTATPDPCYQLGQWIVSDDNGKDIAVSGGTFVMPASDVTVSVDFNGPNHTWDAGTVTTAATCTSTGVTTFVCTVCGETKTESTPALGHDWGAWKVTRAATAAAEGQESRTCNRCGATETRSIPKLDSINYTITSGAFSTWSKGSTNTITIIVKRSEDDASCFSHFTGVQIDGTTLETSDYDAWSGSTVVELKSATLQKYNAGDHTVTIDFDDGSATTTLTVKSGSGAGTGKGAPATGDSIPTGAIAVVAALCVAGLGTAVVARKRMSKNQ